MIKTPRWFNVELLAVSNGWIVKQAVNPSNRGMLTPVDEAFVFNSWNDCSAFLKAATSNDTGVEP